MELQRKSGLAEINEVNENEEEDEIKKKPILKPKMFDRKIQ